MLNKLPWKVRTKFQTTGRLPIIIAVLSSGDLKKTGGLVDVLADHELSVESILDRIEKEE